MSDTCTKKKPRKNRRYFCTGYRPRLFPKDGAILTTKEYVKQYYQINAQCYIKFKGE